MNWPWTLAERRRASNAITVAVDSRSFPMFYKSILRCWAPPTQKKNKKQQQ